jgi:hypothetical protein
MYGQLEGPRGSIAPYLTHGAWRGAWGPLRFAALISLALLALGCQSDPPEGSVDAHARHDEGGTDAQPAGDAAVALDQAVALDRAVSDAVLPSDVAVPADQGSNDADPRSMADLWSPDFGPPPADMPAEIRWMHGRMWCDGPRPPRILPDGTSECEHVEVPTERTERPFACREWPSRTSTDPFGGPEGIDAYIGCSPDYSVCCTFYTYEEYAPPPCHWIYSGFAGQRESALPEEMMSALPWLEANGLRALVPASGAAGLVTDEMVEAWQGALNNCHPICKRPACGP